MVLSVSERTFNQEVLESPTPVLVNFWAPWCGLCLLIQPILLQFQAHCNEPLKLVAINADQNFKLSNAYKLKTLPTIILFQNGEQIKRVESFGGREDLYLELEKLKLSWIQPQPDYAASKVTPTNNADPIYSSLV